MNKLGGVHPPSWYTVIDTSIPSEQPAARPSLRLSTGTLTRGRSALPGEAWDFPAWWRGTKWACFGACPPVLSGFFARISFENDEAEKERGIRAFAASAAAPSMAGGGLCGRAGPAATQGQGSGGSALCCALPVRS